MMEKPKGNIDRYFAVMGDTIYEMEEPEPPGGYTKDHRAKRTVTQQD